ncbi:unnamed protein product [Prorocentrum cordatum]|uniref:Uncharacterized protein n=1 Tax=Prorocentrum cordatum TaxID=2364126 RepID=A0ABN9Y4W6_9DINO|nr:unnamed protein product [Polarella glacialis]
MDVHDHQTLTDDAVRAAAAECYGAGKLTPHQPYITSDAVELVRIGKSLKLTDATDVILEAGNQEAEAIICHIAQTEDAEVVD